MFQFTNVAPHEPCVCDDCDGQFRFADLDPIENIFARLSPNNTVPAGQCPECGCLAYLSQVCCVECLESLRSLHHPTCIHSTPSGNRVEKVHCIEQSEAESKTKN